MSHFKSSTKDFVISLKSDEKSDLEHSHAALSSSISALETHRATLKERIAELIEQLSEVTNDRDRSVHRKNMIQALTEFRQNPTRTDLKGEFGYEMSLAMQLDHPSEKEDSCYHSALQKAFKKLFPSNADLSGIADMTTEESGH